MTNLFLQFFNVSLSAGFLVLAVLLLRPLLTRAPKWSICLLWAVVGLRLVLPFSVESPLSLLPSTQFIPTDIAQTQTPAIHSGIPAINDAVNPALIETFVLDPAPTPLTTLLRVLTVAWLAGFGLVLLYGLISYVQILRRTQTCVPYRDRVWRGDDVVSPFLLDLFRPRIYVPSDLPPEQLDYVLRHEYAHLKRGDHWWKPIGFLLLAIHWYNPFLWVAYILLCRDIERACDEKVVAAMDPGEIKQYVQALVDCATHRRLILACPVAFGEEALKSRVRGILRYKKPVVAMVAAGVLACAALGVCFLTAPVACAHEYQSDAVLRSPTCCAQGMERQVCLHCEDSYATPLAMQEHTYGKGAVTREPTCVTPGTMTYTCADCGQTRAEKMEMLPHTPGEPYAETPANCTTPGEKTATCTLCQAVFVTEILPVNDVHDLKTTSLREATCTQEGEQTSACARCGKTQTVTLEKLSHNYAKESESEGNCRFSGMIRYRCTLCHDIKLVSTPKNPDGHHWAKDLGSTNNAFYCIYCYSRRAISTANNDSSVTSPIGKPAPSQPQLPTIIWDVAESMRPTPGRY